MAITLAPALPLGAWPWAWPAARLALRSLSAAPPSHAAAPPPPPRIVKAAFVKSSSRLDHLPNTAGARRPEFAFIGHSNVGKSSLINALAGEPVALARVSKSPGCTRTLNHYLINNQLYFVDCPGYGYARVSKEQRLDWHRLTQEFLVGRPTLAHTFLVVDSGLPPNSMDLDAALWLHEAQVPYSVVFTKADLAEGQPRPQLRPHSSLSPVQPHAAAPSLASSSSSSSSTAATFMRALQATTGGSGSQVAHVCTSALTRQGVGDLLRLVWAVKEQFKVPVTFR